MQNIGEVVTQAQHMEQELEGTAGDHGGDSSDEERTAPVATLVKET